MLVMGLWMERMHDEIRFGIIICIFRGQTRCLPASFQLLHRQSFLPSFSLPYLSMYENER